MSIRENDPSLVFSDSSLTVPEGETATYTVALATLPTAEVTVRVTGVSGDLSLDRTRLMFTRGDWSDAQTVTVEAAEDDDTSTDPAVTLTHQASGGGYDGIVGELRVSVTEKDGGGGTGGGGGGGAANHPAGGRAGDRRSDAGYWRRAGTGHPAELLRPRPAGRWTTRWNRPTPRSPRSRWTATG